MLTDALDSFYSYVKTRIATINPDRVVAGMLTAQDWPSKPVKNDAFYLLVLGEVPVGKQCFSQTVPIKLHQVQWVWVNEGMDLIQGKRQATRGTRYRDMQTMKGELINGLYPGFTEKLNWAFPNGVATGTSKTPSEVITWTPVEFHEKWDRDSGIGYGSGAVRIQDMTDEITS